MQDLKRHKAMKYRLSKLDLLGPKLKAKYFATMRNFPEPFIHNPILRIALQCFLQSAWPSPFVFDRPFLQLSSSATAQSP